MADLSQRAKQILYACITEFVATGEPVCVDVKGGRATRTEAYRLRRKVFEAIYGLTVTEVG